MQKQPSPAIRVRLYDLGYRWTGHQLPQKDGRKLDRVCEAADPWFVTVYRNDRVSWADGAVVGWGHGATLDAAIEQCLGSDRARSMMTGLLGSMARLEYEISNLARWMTYGSSGLDDDIPF